jgi:hypothetical protein
MIKPAGDGRGTPREKQAASARGSANQININPKAETISARNTPMAGTAAAFKTVITVTATAANTKSDKTLSLVIAIFSP